MGNKPKKQKKSRKIKDILKIDIEKEYSNLSQNDWTILFETDEEYHRRGEF